MVMRVPELQQQFRYQDPRVPAARLQGMQVQTNAAMFGAESGRQLEKAGYLVQRAGDQVAHLVDDYNTTQAREGASQFQQDFLAWQTEAAKKVGKDGISTGQDYDQWAQQRMGELTKGMSEVQRGRFQSLVGERMALQKRWAEGYGQEQDGVYKMSTWKTEMSVAGNTIATNPNDPDMVRQALEQIKNSSFNIAKYKGLDDQAGAVLMQEHVAEYMGGTIHNLIQQGQTGAASALMKQHGEEIGGAAMGKLNVAMARELEHQEAKAKAAAAEANLVKAEGVANELYARVESGKMNSEEALLKIREIADPKLQARARSSYMERLQIAEVARKESVARGHEKAADDFERTGNNIQSQYDLVQSSSRAALNPGATQEQKAYAKAMREQYRFSVQYAEEGIRTGSNPTAFDAMTEEIAQGITLKQARASEHWSKLSTSARRSFETTIKEGMGYNAAEAIRFYDELHQERIGRPYNKKIDQGDRERFQQYVLENVRATGKGKDQAYLQRLADQWWTKGSLANSGPFRDTHGTYGRLNKRDQFLPEIDEKTREGTLKMFNANPEVKAAYLHKYGNMNYALRGYHKEQNEKAIGPKGGM